MEGIESEDSEHVAQVAMWLDGLAGLGGWGVEEKPDSLSVISGRRYFER